jgi:hypothetical protein
VRGSGCALFPDGMLLPGWGCRCIITQWWSREGSNEGRFHKDAVVDLSQSCLV